MKRKIFSLVCGSVMALSMSAQPIDSLLVSVPDQVMPFLERNSRLDMLDLYNCGMKAAVSNDMNGDACLLEKDSVHFLVQTTSVSTFSTHLLSYKNDTLLACVRTVKMPERHSQLNFYNKHWQPVKIKMPESPSFDACWQPSDSLSEDRREMLRLALQPGFFYAEWHMGFGKEPRLIFRVSTDGLTEADRKEAETCLKPLVYVWRDQKLVVDQK